MVNKLLDFSSLEGGRMRVKYHPVKLVRFLSQLTRILLSIGLII